MGLFGGIFHSPQACKVITIEYSTVQRKVQSYTQVTCTCVNPRVQLHVCIICLSTCHDYLCLCVVSADVACIPECTCVYTCVLLDFSLKALYV